MNLIARLLENFYPAVLGLLFFSWVILFCVNLPNFKSAFSELSSPSRWKLGLIFLLSLILRLVFSPRLFQVYYDELTFLEMAKQIAQIGKALVITGDGNPLYLPAPLGWEFILSLFFRFLPTIPEVAFYLNIFISALTVVPLFFLSRFLFKNEEAARFATLLFAFLPVALRVSASAALEPSALFFLLFGCWCLILAFNYQNQAAKFLALFTLLYLLNLRQESFFYFIPLLMVFYLLFGKLRFNRRDPLNYAGILFALYFSLPYFLLIAYGLLKGFYYFYEPAQLRLIHIKENLIYNLLFFLKNHIHPVFLTVLALAGGLVGRGEKKSLGFLIFWFFYGYLFYSLNPSCDFYLKHSLDSWRLSLYLYPPVLILAGIGINWLYQRKGRIVKALVLSVILLMPLLYAPFIKGDNLYIKEYKFLFSARSLLPREKHLYTLGGNNLPARDMAFLARWVLGEKQSKPLPNDFGELKELLKKGEKVYLFSQQPAYLPGFALELLKAEKIPPFPFTPAIYKVK